MLDLQEPTSKLQSNGALLSVAAACISTVVLALGALRCLSTSLAQDGQRVSAFVVDGGVLWVSIVGAVIGRLISIWIQSEAVAAAAGAAGRVRATRLQVIQGVLRSQFPVAAGDLIIGLCGLLGLVNFQTLIALAMSPLNPFLLWSVFVFLAAIRKGIPGAPYAKARRRSVLAFMGFLYWARLMVFVTGLAPKV